MAGAPDDDPTKATSRRSRPAATAFAACHRNGRVGRLARLASGPRVPAPSLLPDRPGRVGQDASVARRHSASPRRGSPRSVPGGAQFGKGDLWASIADQLGLKPVGADVLLGAMDAAGEAASTSGRRFVIFVDALNETTPPSSGASTYRRCVRPSHASACCACRLVPGYLQDLVLEGDEGSHYIRRAHPGFAEREIEATSGTSTHYKLEAPKIPLLTPEFTLPLFLRLYCESLSHPRRADPGRPSGTDRHL